MNRQTQFNRPWLKSFLLSSLMTPLFASATPGTISDVPLFTINAAESNIFFMLDDSGSMDLEIMTSELDPASNGWDGSLVTAGRQYRYISPDNVDHNFGDYFAPNEEDVAGYGLWLARNHHYNHIYYNPAITYEPWIGVDSASNPYKKYTSANVADISSVRQFPYNSSSPTFDLTATHSSTTDRPDNGNNITVSLYVPHYYVWDSVNDALGTAGTIEKGDNKQRIEIKSGTSVCSNGTSATEKEQYDNSCMLRSYNDEIANFANWWTYHRRREYVAKNGVSNVIAGANGIRLGMGNIHNVSSYRAEIAPMNADVASGAKNALLNKVFSLQSDQGGTPLKSALNNAGNYYACSGTNLFGNTNCPILTTVVSPATEAAGVCQQNFTILVTDGFYASESISGIANDDGDGSTTSATNGHDGTSYTFKFDGDPYADTKSDTLADIAMHYYERDLDTTLANKVPTKCGVDENPMQHMVTYTLSMGLSGTLDATTIPDHPQTGFELNSDNTAKCPAEVGTAFTWPDPSTNNAHLIDDLLHAAYNGRGLFAAANKPEDVATAIENAFNNAADRTGSAAAVSFNSTTLSANSAVYLALFKAGAWSGDLKSFPLDPNTGTVSSTLIWSAATKLDTDPYTSRVIVTYDNTAATPAGIPFTWSDINTAMKDDLRVKPDGTTDSDANAQARLNYLRGDTTNEGTGLNFRIRSSRLGDIVHSAPAYVGRPPLAWPDGDGDNSTSTTNGWPEGNDDYSVFKNFNQGDATPGMKDRSGVIYVGANDGMLHGFRESDGKEVLGYIPSNLFSTSTTEGLHHLADPAYAHRYFVDLSPTVADAYVKSRASTGTKKWRTVLVGGNGAGGSGIFALDVTNPSLLSEANADDIVLWEFTSADDSRLGKTLSRPVIVPTYATDADGHYRWIAIFGNGYNNTNDGKASLFVLFLDGGLDGVWTEGTDYFVLTTPAGSITGGDCSAVGSDCNGMSSPAAVDLDSDSVVDTVYAGDLHGNIWAFNLTSSTPANWEIIHGNANNEPLFTAKDSGGNRQPITTRPQVVRNPGVVTANTNEPNVLVMFGTGQYLATGDASTNDVQTFYAVWDNDEGNNATGSKLRADLQAQTIIQESTVSGKEIRVISDNTIDWTNKEGWYLDLAFDSNGDNSIGSSEQLGERLVTSPVVRGEIIFFNSSIPSPNPCSAGGDGWQMSLDYANGGRPDYAIFDVDGDGVVDASDLLDHDSNSATDAVAAGGEKFNNGMPSSPSFLGNRRYTTGTGGDGNIGTGTGTGGSDDDLIEDDELVDLGGYKTGRLSWQQLQ